MFGDTRQGTAGLWKLDAKTLEQVGVIVTDDTIFNKSRKQYIQIRSVRCALLNSHGLAQYLLVQNSLRDRKQVSPQDLESRAALLQAVLDANPGPVIATCANRRVAYANPEMNELLNNTATINRILDPDTEGLMERLETRGDTHGF